VKRKSIPQNQMTISARQNTFTQRVQLMLELSSEQIEHFQKKKQLRILIYRFGQLGDTLIALPALWAIRSAFPQANLSFLTSDHPGRGFILPQDILPRKGLIDDWLSYTREGSSKYGGLFQLWRTLRARRFDLLIYLVPRMRPRLSVWRDLVFFRSVGIRYAVGQKGLRSLPSRVPGQPLPPIEHEADHLLQRLALSHIPIPASNCGNMDLVLTSEENQNAEDWLRSNIPGYSSALSLVAIGPGGKRPVTIWPVERFAELGGHLISELSLFPIVFGGPNDVPVANQFIKQWGEGACAAGALGVRSAAAALARCRLYVGNDTGTVHLAAAARVPCVGIYSARNWPGRWDPYGSCHIVLRRPVSCEGCHLDVCIKEGMRCIKEISVEDVLRACRTLLRGKTS
jgi:lipopolysaccharide heptosyltransferase III